jgi:hypothetical protein
VRDQLRSLLVCFVDYIFNFISIYMYIRSRDIYKIGHPLKPDKPVALRTCPVSGKECWLYDGASVAAIIPHFEDLSDLRVSDLRTVNGEEKMNIQHWYLMPEKRLKLEGA